MYYIILLLVIIFVTFLFSRFNVDVKNNKKYLFTIFVILTFFLGLRGNNVGLDMKNYHSFFKLASTSSFSYLISNVEFEIGFKIFTKIITLFTNNFNIYIFVTAILSISGIYYFIKENSKDYFASIFMFVTFSFYIYLFCTLRQAIAISVLLFSFNCLRNNKNFLYFLLVILATTFHKTAIVFLILYFIKNIKLKKIHITIYLCSCFLLFALKKPIIAIFTRLIYSQYVGFQDTSGGGYIMLILLLAIILGICFFLPKYNQKNNIYINMLLIAIPFQILSTEQGLLARIVLYFTISLIILLPNVITKFDKIYKNKIRYAYYISLTLFYIFEVFNNAVYVPYTFLEVIL